MSTKNSHLDWSDEAFLHDFGACSFPAELFDHEAHLRLAWLHLQQVTIDQAIILVTQQLKKYVQHLGAAEKYHATVTVAGVELVHHFLKKGTTSSFEEYLLKYPMVKTAFKMRKLRVSN